MPAKTAIRVVWLCVAIGVLNAVVFKLFEFAVNHGTNYVWNELFKSDIHRWVVVPLAVGLGVGLSGLFIWAKRQRITVPKLDSLSPDDAKKPVSLTEIGVTAVIGIVSLIAGASLGPEASLVMISSGLGLWFARRAGLGETAELLLLASVGALLVAFVGSVVLILLPLLLLWQKKRLHITTAVPVIVAGLSAYLGLWLMDHQVAGYGSIPAKAHFSAIDLLVALTVGFVAAWFGWLLKKAIFRLAVLTKRLNSGLPWAASGAVFGLVLGLLYLVGGQSIQFSGSEGSHLLLQHMPAYSLGALIGILFAKLFATAWSLAAGYQGGLVFPSIFSGVALSLIAEHVFHITSPGVVLGGVAGIFGAMTNPAAAFIFILGIIPVKLVGTAATAIIGAAAGNKLITKFSAPPSS